MAAEPCASVSESEKTSEKSDYDASLDFFSDKFDPLKALQTPGLVPPVINARVHDNIAKYVSSQTNVSADRKKKETEAQPESAPLERNWLPHQLPVKRKSRTRRNLLTRMEKMEGPLKLLKKCKDEHIRIKVWTRHSHGIRGYCLGYITAFDKHWNMSMEDITEVWTRRKRRKIPALGDELKQPSKNRVVPPEIKILETSKKTETCQRYIDQLLIRGEQVAFVALC